MPTYPPSERQLNYIRTLVTERAVTITALSNDERNRLLRSPQTSREASNLIDALRRIPVDRKEVDPDRATKIDYLSGYYDRFDARDLAFAQSLVKQFVARGDLSEGQWSWVDKLIEKATAPKVEIEPGLYLVDDRIIKVYLTQNRRLATKSLHVTGSHGTFQYAPGWLSKVRPEHRLTEDQARAFGKQHGFCCACARSLDDERSLAVGYGPVCASNFGWFYPTGKQASEILARPTDLVSS